jgi:hypothetical protein
LGSEAIQVPQLELHHPYLKYHENWHSRELKFKWALIILIDLTEKSQAYCCRLVPTRLAISAFFHSDSFHLLHLEPILLHYLGRLLLLNFSSLRPDWVRIVCWKV